MTDDSPRYRHNSTIRVKPDAASLPRNRTPIPRSPVKAKRGKPKRFAKRRDPGYCAWVRTLRCAIPPMTVEVAMARGRAGHPKPHWLSCWPPQEAAAYDLGVRVSECAHAKTRSTGGDDRGNTLPLCKRHHAQQHAIGIKTFQENYGIDMAKIASDLWDMYLRDHPEAADERVG